MSWQSDVANGLAQLLADADLGTWNPDAAGGTIVRGSLPPDTLGIGIQTYRAGDDDPAHPTTQLRVQFWLRAADIDTLDDLDSGIYDVLMGLSGSVFGGTHLTDTGAISAVPMGLDGQGNPERACSYRLELDLPATALRSYDRS